MLDLTKAVSSATNANNQPKKVNSNVKTTEAKKSEEVEKVVEKPEEKLETTTPQNDDLNKLNAGERTPNSVNLKVSPDIFVSLKKGIISNYYKVGKTLGEGKKIEYLIRMKYC